MGIRLLFTIISLLIFLSLLYSSRAEPVYSVASGILIDIGMRVLASNFSGSTSDFLRMNDSQLSSMENLTLESPAYGKIIFIEEVNLSLSAVGGIVNLDSNVNISFNRVYVNRPSVISLNKSSRMWLYNISFVNPRILVNNGICSSCAIESFIGGTLIFNSTHSSASAVIYASQETPEANESTPAATPSGGGGGGGGGGVSGKETLVKTEKEVLNISVVPKFIDVKVKQGERVQRSLTLVNWDERDILLTLEINGSGNIILPEGGAFILKKGESKNVSLYFFAGEEEIPSVQAVRIGIHSGLDVRYANVLIEVVARNPLFDVSSTLIDDDIYTGDKINADIEMINVGDRKKVDIILEYFIIDFLGNKIKLEEETKSIDGTLRIRKSFRLSESLKPGEYVFYVRLSYGNAIATSANHFTLTERNLFRSLIIAGLVALIIIFTVLITVLAIKWISYRERKVLVSKLR